MLLFLFVFAAAGATDAKKPASVAVLPIQAKGKADKKVLEVLDDLLLSALQNRAGDGMRIVGKSDIDAMLGFEKTKDAMGCSEVTCAAELAGALGVDALVSASAGTLGEKYILTLVLIDQKKAVAQKRVSQDLGRNEEHFGDGIESAVAQLLPGAATAPKQRCESLDDCKKRCDGGEKVSCNLYGWHLMLGAGNAEGARGIFTKLCETDDPGGCNSLGWLHKNGWGVAADAKRAVDLFQRACGKGPKYCDGLAWALADGSGIGKDEARAVQLFDASCATGYPPGCSGLGWMLADGRGGNRDEARASAVFERACSDDTFFCDGIGWMKVQGRGTAKEPAAGVKHFEQACNRANAWGCWGLGLMYKDGTGVAKDLDKARTLLRSACGRGVKRACEAL